MLSSIGHKVCVELCSTGHKISVVLHSTGHYSKCVCCAVLIWPLSLCIVLCSAGHKTGVVLCSLSFAVWCNSAIVEDQNSLARIVLVASRIVGYELPTLDNLYSARVVKKAQSTVSKPGHPVHELFEMLPSGRRLKALKSGSKHTHDSFYPTAVRTTNDIFFAHFPMI